MFCCVILSHTCFKPLYATFLKYILEPSVHCSTAWYWRESWLIFWGYFDKNVLGRVFWGDFGGRSRFKVVSIVQRGWESIVNASLTLSSVTIIPWTSALMWCNCSRLILAAGVYKLTQSPASVCVCPRYITTAGIVRRKLNLAFSLERGHSWVDGMGSSQEFSAHSRATSYVTIVFFNISFNR